LLNGLRLCRGETDDRATDAQLDALNRSLLSLPAREHALVVVRLDPAFEKARRNGKMNGILVDLFQVHTCKPAQEDVVADVGAKTTLHARPALLIKDCGFAALRQFDGAV